MEVLVQYTSVMRWFPAFKAMPPLFSFLLSQSVSILACIILYYEVWFCHLLLPQSYKLCLVHTTLIL